MKHFLKANLPISLRTFFTLAKHIYGTSDFRAIMNAIVVPALLSLVTQSLLSGIIWVLFVCYIYKFQKVNTERGRVFFEYLKFILTIIIVVFISITAILITEFV